MGTAVNVAAVIAGGLLGLLLQKGIQKRYQEILTQAMGLCVLFLGIAGAMTGLLKLSDAGQLTTAGTAVLIGSMLAGSLLGELLGIEAGLERFGAWLRRTVRSEGDPRFVEGFVNASLTVCIGAMAVVGALEDGLTGDASMLYTKAALDFVIVLVFASSYGRGAIFSAIPIAVLQGGVTLCAVFLAPLLSGEVISSLSFLGSVLIFCVGVNLCFGKRFRVANMLPALIFAGILAAIL